MQSTGSTGSTAGRSPKIKATTLREAEENLTEETDDGTDDALF
jgi:hypothetical protein